MGDVAGQQDTAGAGAEGRLFGDEALQRFEQAVAFQEFQECSRFAARQDQAVEAVQLRRFSYLDGIGARLFQRLGVSGKVSLDGEHADARTFVRTA